MSAPAPRLVPPVYFFIALAAMLLVDRVLPVARFIPYPATLVGVMPLLVGLGLVLATAAALRRHGTTIKPHEVPSALVTEGVFRVSRNPIYLGLVLMLFGAALMLGSAGPFLVVAAFAGWMQMRFIAHEEAVLRGHFGAAYDEYCAAVRRWL